MPATTPGSAAPNPAAEADARRWLRQAECDIEAGEHSRDGGFHAVACFLAQQAAEKSVAAYLIARGAERVWGHALADLCEDAMALDPTFDVIKSVAILLDKHFLGARYPSALPGGVPHDAYDELDSQRALEIARDAREFVLRRLSDLAGENQSGGEIKGEAGRR